MAEEQATDKAEDAAKGMADQFLQTLGLVDLIIGALTLYWVRLWLGKAQIGVLEPTGYPWLDIGLLACAAALVGKIVSTGADMFAGLRDWLRREDNDSKKQLKEALRLFKEEIGDNSGVKDEIDAASRYITARNPRLQPELDAIYHATTLAYSMTFLSVLFSIYFWSKKVELADVGPSALLVVIPAILALGFVVFGLLKQDDYLDTVTDKLNYATAELKMEKQQRPAAAVVPQQAANAPINVAPISVALSSVPQLAIELSAKNISLEVVRVIRKEDS